MTKDQYENILSDLDDRSNWETKQLTWYKVRHSGLRRASKPYPNAPDMHFPLADTLIEKLKGFYVQLLYAAENFASFICKKADQNSELTTAVGGWFDYWLKQRSNFEREIMIGVDQMLQCGKVPVKVRWDNRCNRLAFDAIDPLHLIVPKGTQELCDADRLVHVIQMSEDKYRANKNYNQDDDYIKSIKGKGSSNDIGDSSDKAQNKELREGVGYSDNGNTIVIWECYFRDRETQKIKVETISPILGPDKEPIRQPFTLPYNRGTFKSGERFPFAVVRTEIKDKGYYSERGIPEVVFQEEQFLNKTWNTECTWMDFFAQPQFRATKSIANPSNYRSRPGAVVPDGLELVQPPDAPELVENLKGFARALAEYRVNMPDFGTQEHLGPQARQGGKQTATWTNAVMGLAQVSNDVRSRVFRLDLGEILNLSWSILIQFAKDELTYVVQNEVVQLDPAALHDDYEIHPSGSADSWNKGAQLQKAGNRFQNFRGDPFINQGELRKSVLELDDPRLVQRLYQDPGHEQRNQAEEQAKEITVMLIGWPAEVDPSDDDKTHLLTLAQFLQRRLMTGELVTPEFARLVLQHGAAHDQQLAQKKDPQIATIRQQMKPLIAILTQIAGSDQQQPGNVVPGPGAAPTSPQPNVAPSGALPSAQPQPVPAQ